MHGRYSFQSFVVRSSCGSGRSEVYAKLNDYPFFKRKYLRSRTSSDEKSPLFSDSFKDGAAMSGSPSALAESRAVRLTPTAELRKFADSICEMRVGTQVETGQVS
jgi:hypothetical protein